MEISVKFFNQSHYKMEKILTILSDTDTLVYNINPSVSMEAMFPQSPVLA